MNNARTIHLISNSNGAYDDPDLWCDESSLSVHYSENYAEVNCLRCLNNCVEYGDRVRERLIEVAGSRL